MRKNKIIAFILVAMMAFMEQKDTDGGHRYDAVWFGWEEGK